MTLPTPDQPTPAPPIRPVLEPDSPLTQLRGRVIEALSALPGYFTSKTTIEGLAATDLFSLNTVLGATIEVQVVETLNRMRDAWDPDDQWPMHTFERQAQTFPDVRLVSRAGGTANVALGIELKGWYLLAKEKEPSLRYKVTPSACADADLVVVVPWYLSNVLAGTPVTIAPWVESARYAAEFRNYWWEHIRQTPSDAAIDLPDAIGPYPTKDQLITDRPHSDGGSNFGRIARINDLMGTFIADALTTLVAGIPAEDWVQFFRTYSENRDPEQIKAMLRARYAAATAAGTHLDGERIIALLDELAALLDQA